MWKMLNVTLLLLIYILAPRVAHSQYTQYVNPFIGTGGHGHTYPGVSLPFGMVQLSPDTRTEGWDACSGYYYADSTIYGFSHTHLSGTGCADYCDILLMPTTGKPVLDPMPGGDVRKGYASRFSHATEEASPGYYSVWLDDDSIHAELTCTQRVGLHKYSFPATDAANIILDLTHRDKLLDSTYIRIVSDTKIEGLRRSRDWAQDQWLYFAIEFSQPITSAGISNDGQMPVSFTENTSLPLTCKGTALKAYFRFHSDGHTPVYVKCALSAVSCTGAWNNMQQEMPGWDFDKVRNQADSTWNKALSQIEVFLPGEKQKPLRDSTNKLVIFYTALYHCLLVPNIYSDVNGDYRGRDMQVHHANGFDYYTVFSLWDTFRGEHPLFTIIQQKRSADFINTFLKEYEQGGRLPVWELSSNETDCMIGYHSVSVIADAAVKGIGGFDYAEAYRAMKHSAELSLYGLGYYRDKGFIASNEEGESVSRTLEYSYDDWCIAQMAELVHAPETDIDSFLRRGRNFQNLYHDGFMQPRTNGGWYQPFDPSEVNFNYTEANAWQYTFFVPQDLGGHFNASGTQSASYMEERLDSLFTVSPHTNGREQVDISGLIGQYAHGNEPSHHIAYLYDYVGAPHKTAYRVHEIMNDFYKNAPDGLIGNEDCGQMSAWYVLSALGFYPVCPGWPYYAIGSPAFTEVRVHLENGKSFVVHAENLSDKNFYIQSATWQGEALNSTDIAHASLMQGGKLDCIMGPEPRDFAVQSHNSSDTSEVPRDPVIGPGDKIFFDSTDISVEAPGMTLYYTMDGKAPGMHSNQVTNMLHIKTDTSCVLKVMACNPQGICSGITTAHFTKIATHYKVRYITMYDHQYSAAGAVTLIDGQRGSGDFRTGNWQGWEGKNMEVVLDLGGIQEVSEAGGGFLQDVKSWIWMPVKLEVLGSEDGEHFHSLGTVMNTVPDTVLDSKAVQDLSVHFDTLQVRYIKFIAYNYGTIPAWHPGAGGKAWVFSDEVWVK